MNVLLVGQNELNTIVGELQNHDLGRRIAARHRIDPLTATEAGEYIGHRLKVAGAERNPFGWEAILQIGALSRGVPRVINMIADLALLSGSRHKADTITSDMVTECARDLGLVDAGDERRTRRRYALPAATRRAMGTRRRGHAAAYAALLALLVVIGGSLYAQGRLERRHEPVPEAPKSSRGGERPSGGDGDAGVRQPVPAREAQTEAPATMRRDTGETLPASAAPLSTRSSIPPGVAEERDKPVGDSRVSQKDPAGSTPKAKAAPPSRESASAERVESDSTATAPRRARVAPPARDDASREGAEAPDPNAIIDWLLQEYPARRY